MRPPVKLLLLHIAALAAAATTLCAEEKTGITQLAPNSAAEEEFAARLTAHHIHPTQGGGLKTSTVFETLTKQLPPAVPPAAPA